MRWFFGAHGQVAIGVIACAASLLTWAYGTTLHGDALIRLLFHVSMAALVLAAYAIVATGLGYRASERIEEVVTDTMSVDAEHVDVDAESVGVESPDRT